MKSQNQTVKPNKGQAPLCNSCAHRFLHPEGHDEPCLVPSIAELSPQVNGNTGPESCTHYIYRTTIKEEVHQMSEAQNTTTEQQPTLVNLAGPASVTLNTKFIPQDNKTKHTLSLSLDVSEEDIEAVRTLTKQRGVAGSSPSAWRASRRR